MSDLRSSNIYDMLDEDGGASAAVQAKKDTKSTPAEKPSNKKVDAPHKKEKPAKNEEPAAPVGKEQRGAGGRDQKPRGRGRDNKGGLRRPAGATGREFDRRSGPSATHRNPRDGKRNGAGQHNWGEQTEEATKAAEPTEETPTSPIAPVDATQTEAPAVENKDETVAAPVEEEDNTVTFDQYLSKKASQAPEGDKLEARAADNDAFEGVAVKEVTSDKKKKKTTQQEEDDEEKKEKAARKKKNVVTLDEFRATAVTSRAPREARESRPPRTENSERGTSERGRGRGAPRGGPSRGGARGGRGGRGGGGSRPQAAVVVDDTNYPKLGK